MAYAGNDPLQKIETAKIKKEEADNAFKQGNLQTALLKYHEALMYLQGLDKNMLNAMSGGSSAKSPPAEVSDGEDEIETPGVKARKEEPEKKELSEVDDLLSKIYSNQSACHIKKQNWKRALETAEKSMSKNPENFKAQFRKGKALAELGYVEKSLATLEELLKKNPADQASINAEIARVKAADREREKKHNQKFKGFLNKKTAPKSFDSVSSTPSNTSSSSVQSTESEASTASVASSTGTVPAPNATLEPSGLVEVSEEEFEKAKRANARDRKSVV